MMAVIAGIDAGKHLLEVSVAEGRAKALRNTASACKWAASAKNSLAPVRADVAVRAPYSLTNLARRPGSAWPHRFRSRCSATQPMPVVRATAPAQRHAKTVANQLPHCRPVPVGPVEASRRRHTRRRRRQLPWARPAAAAVPPGAGSHTAGQRSRCRGVGARYIRRRAAASFMRHCSSNPTISVIPCYPYPLRAPKRPSNLPSILPNTSAGFTSDNVDADRKRPALTTDAS